jgi:hypothetical protein
MARKHPASPEKISPRYASESNSRSPRGYSEQDHAGILETVKIGLEGIEDRLQAEVERAVAESLLRLQSESHCKVLAETQDGQLDMIRLMSFLNHMHMQMNEFSSTIIRFTEDVSNATKSIEAHNERVSIVEEHCSTLMPMVRNQVDCVTSIARNDKIISNLNSCRWYQDHRGSTEWQYQPAW